ncbi:MAG: hypothetical protein IID41_10930, partial [Planctomycetes bacterium]|nr:hypothetical protein [Planctomycetota bacterium]
DKKKRQLEYEAEGETAKDAHIMALNDFPPLGEDEEVIDMGLGTPDGPPFDLPKQAEPEPAEVDLSTPDALRDADWVYSNLNAKGLSRQDAPSQAAWTMFCDFGKTHSTRIKFYEKVLEPLLKRARVGESYSDDGRVEIALCVRKRAEFAADRDASGELAARLDELREESDAMAAFVDRARRLIRENEAAA